MKNAGSSEAHTKLAVLLLGFGGPESPADVRPFITNVVRGRNVPPARLELVAQQYERIGGRSPFNELTDKQALALQESLSNDLKIKVYTGMLFWHPYIAETLQRLQDDGVEEAITIIMAPQRTQASHQRYIAAAEQALAQIEPEPNPIKSALKLTYVPAWNTHELFIQAIVERVKEKLTLLSEQQLATVQLIFTAHSVPTAMADSSNYAAEIKDTAQSVVRKLNNDYGKDFPARVAYQSRSGSPAEPWLTPAPNEVMDAAIKAGISTIIIVPIGFVCDHVEVLYDLDILAKEHADKIGLTMFRAGTVGDHRLFIRLLDELTRTAIESCYAQSKR